MVDRMGDTRTQAPCVYNGEPWWFNFGGGLGLDKGNFEQFQASANLMWQQNFDSVSYYIQGNYTYLNRNLETVMHKATGTIRTDVHLKKLSDTVSLSLPVIGTAAYYNLEGLEPRVTLGSGLWLDYKHPKDILQNGFSVFFVEEYERGGGFPDKWTPTVSFRDFLKVTGRKGVDFICDAFFVQSLTEQKNFRFSFAPSLDVKLNDTFSLVFASGFEYTNRPRNPLLKNYDLTTTAGLKVNLGPREKSTSRSTPIPTPGVVLGF